MSESKKNKKIQPVKILFKNIEWKYFSDKGYFKNLRTNFGDQAYWQHQNKIAELRRKNNNHKNTANTVLRAFVVAITTICVALLNDFYVPWFVADSDNIFLKITSVGISGIVMSAPIIFVIWIFRDINRLMELENARKDTNLKEFQQLQRWATGNIDGNNETNKIALQISALHSLRAYLKGEYGESFRRGAYEIFRANLATQHQKILQQVKDEEFNNIRAAIDNCQLTKQLNIIASEEWFNLLINHNFPTNNISLLGVDLHGIYLRHRTYGKMLDLQSAQLQGANLIGTDLRSAQLQGTGFKDAQLQSADLKGAQLQGANLMGTQLQAVDLRNAQLQAVDLRNAQLQGANLRTTQLQGANLMGAKLQGVDLLFAQLQGANLRNAQLQGANLQNAQLQGVYIADDTLNLEQRIEQQIGKDTDQGSLKKQHENQYETFESTQKAGLIAELKTVDSAWVDSVWIDAAIQRIESASDTLDLSEATTGKYSQKEADKWLKNYDKMTKE